MLKQTKPTLKIWGKNALLLLTGAALTFNACKKDKPTEDPIDPKKAQAEVLRHNIHKYYADSLSVNRVYNATFNSYLDKVETSPLTINDTVAIAPLARNDVIAADPTNTVLSRRATKFANICAEYKSLIK